MFFNCLRVDSMYVFVHSSLLVCVFYEGVMMKVETTEFYKVARKQEPKRFTVSKREAWENRAYSGTVKRIKTQMRDNEKML